MSTIGATQVHRAGQPLVSLQPSISQRCGRCTQRYAQYAAPSPQLRRAPRPHIAKRSFTHLTSRRRTPRLLVGTPQPTTLGHSSFGRLLMTPARQATAPTISCRYSPSSIKQGISRLNQRRSACTTTDVWRLEPPSSTGASPSVSLHRTCSSLEGPARWTLLSVWYEAQSHSPRRRRFIGVATTPSPSLQKATTSLMWCLTSTSPLATGRPCSKLTPAWLS